MSILNIPYALLFYHRYRWESQNINLFYFFTMTKFCDGVRNYALIGIRLNQHNKEKLFTLIYCQKMSVVVGSTEYLLV